MDIHAKKLLLIEWLLKLQDERMLGRIEDLKEQSDFWSELSTEQKARIEQGLQDLNQGKKTSYEEIIANHRR